MAYRTRLSDARMAGSTCLNTRTTSGTVKSFTGEPSAFQIIPHSPTLCQATRGGQTLDCPGREGCPEPPQIGAKVRGESDRVCPIRDQRRLRARYQKVDS